MARHETVQVPAGEWVELTDSDVSHARIQGAVDAVVYLQATSGATPTSRSGAIAMAPFGIIPSSVYFTDLFMGVDDPRRLFAWCSTATEVSISHY